MLVAFLGSCDDLSVTYDEVGTNDHADVVHFQALIGTGGGILGRVRAATSRRLPALRPASSTQTSERFSGGEATVVSALTALGCSIIRVGENEVVAMVVNYFEVLHAQSQGGLQHAHMAGLRKQESVWL